MAVDSMRLKAVSFCALLPSRVMCISVQRCSRRIAGVWMLFGIARVSFVTVSGFRRYLIMFDFGHRCSQLGNDIWMVRIESFSGRSGALEGLLRGVLHICVRNKAYHRSTMFFHFDRGSLMLVSAVIFWTVLLRTAQRCSLVREVFS